MAADAELIEYAGAVAKSYQIGANDPVPSPRHPAEFAELV